MSLQSKQFQVLSTKFSGESIYDSRQTILHNSEDKESAIERMSGLICNGFDCVAVAPSATGPKYFDLGQLIRKS